MNANEKMKILIPLDSSSAGDAILLAIFPLIRPSQVESELFHVADSEEDKKEAGVHLAQRRKSLEGQGVATQTRIVSGRPAEEIVRRSKAGEFHLIAMTTHGRTGLERVVMGSVAEEVVRSSAVPVLLCKSDSRVGDWERIVVALDGTPGSEEILTDVIRLARSLPAEVHLVRVGLPLLMSDAYRSSPYKFPALDATSYLQTVADRLGVQGVSAVVEKREGIASVEIPRLAAEIDAGLICLTTEGRPEQSPGMDRSVAAEVIRHAPCPVYVRHMAGSPGTKPTSKRSAEVR